MRTTCASGMLYEMFRSNPVLSFEYLADSGAYAECSKDAQSAFALVYNAWKEGHQAISSCFQFGATFYEACVDTTGVLSQKNFVH